MGKKRGWFVKPYQGGLLARVRDPARGTYRSKKFPREAQEGAEAWARREAARYQLGLVPIGGCPTLAYIEDYLGELRRRRRTDAHIDEVLEVLKGLAAAVPDLADPRAGAQARTWARGLETGTRRRRGVNAHLPATTHTRSASAINRFLGHARAYGRWLVLEERLTTSVIERLQRVKQAKTVRPLFTVDELRQMLTRRDHPAWPRLVLWTYFGMRSSEVATWRRSGQVLVVLGKGRKERIVPVPREVEQLAWLPPAPLEPWNLVRSRRMLLRLMQDCGIPVAGRTVHSLRHTWASLLCASGESLTIVQDRAGHESIVTTAHYAKLAASYPEAREWIRGELQILGTWWGWSSAWRISSEEVSQ